MKPFDNIKKMQPEWLLGAYIASTIIFAEGGHYDLANVAISTGVISLIIYVFITQEKTENIPPSVLAQKAKNFLNFSWIQIKPQSILSIVLLNYVFISSIMISALIFVGPLATSYHNIIFVSCAIWNAALTIAILQKHYSTKTFLIISGLYGCYFVGAFSVILRIFSVKNKAIDLIIICLVLGSFVVAIGLCVYLLYKKFKPLRSAEPASGD
ncbi:MAG: hypothetical protein AAF228_05930 [Pseudomonadota bacterium]